MDREENPEANGRASRDAARGAAVRPSAWPWTVPVAAPTRDAAGEASWRSLVSAPAVWGDAADVGCDAGRAAAREQWTERSWSEGLPIPAETKTEYDALVDPERMVCAGNVEGLVSLVRDWRDGAPGVTQNDAKVAFVQRAIEDSSEKGNLVASAATCTRGLYRRREAAACRAAREPVILEGVRKGDPVAQFAAGMYLFPNDSSESVGLLTAAAAGGISDAAFYLVRNFGYATYRKRGHFPGEEETLRFVMRGAEADAGVFAPQLQARLGEAYAAGDCGLPADLPLAREWLGRAVSGGCVGAVASLVRVERLLGEARGV